MKLDRSGMTLVVMLALLAGVVGWQTGVVQRFVPGPPPVVVPVKDALVVIAYEKDDGPLPAYASGEEGAAGKLRKAGREVRLLDLDATTGLGTTPKYFVEAKSRAKAVGTPALVLVSEDKVVKAVKLPGSTEAIIAEAAQ